MGSLDNKLIKERIPNQTYKTYTNKNSLLHHKLLFLFSDCHTTKLEACLTWLLFSADYYKHDLLD